MKLATIYIFINYSENLHFYEVYLLGIKNHRNQLQSSKKWKTFCRKSNTGEAVRLFKRVFFCFEMLEINPVEIFSWFLLNTLTRTVRLSLVPVW